MLSTGANGLRKIFDFVQSAKALHCIDKCIGLVILRSKFKGNSTFVMFAIKNEIKYHTVGSIPKSNNKIGERG